MRHSAAGSGEGWDPRDASVDPLAARGRGRRGADSRSRSPADARGGGCHQPVGAGPWVRSVQPRAGPATGTAPIRLSFKAPVGAVVLAGAPVGSWEPVHLGKRAFSATIKCMRGSAAVKSRGDCERGENGSPSLSVCPCNAYGDSRPCDFVAGGTAFCGSAWKMRAKNSLVSLSGMRKMEPTLPGPRPKGPRGEAC